VPVAQACNPNYLGNREGGDPRSKPAQANSSLDSISKITGAKWTGGVAQGVAHLICNHKALSANPSLEGEGESSLSLPGYQ
jgi:hypothetical protein